MRIIAFGDVHMSLGGFRRIPGIDTADLLLITGDLTNYGGRAEVKSVLDQILAVNQRVLAVPGNLDENNVDAYLTELGISLHGKGRVLHGIGLFGVGGSNITPFATPTEFSEARLAQLLKTGYAQVASTVKHRILVSHAPPYGTRCDRISNGAHVGSTAVRAFIEQHQPSLCITGHIHEARNEDRIDKTIILNPGMIKDNGWVEITLNQGVLSATLQPAGKTDESIPGTKRHDNA